jgi:hypothetical protein
MDRRSRSPAVYPVILHRLDFRDTCHAITVNVAHTAFRLFRERAIGVASALKNACADSKTA